MRYRYACVHSRLLPTLYFGIKAIALTLLIVSSMVLTASSQEQVTWTVYVQEGNLNGTMLSNVQVIGQDAAGNGFQGITD